MRVGIIQFSPTPGKTVRNMKQVDRILRESATGQLDMLVLPEMAFSGSSLPQIRNYFLVE
jgi:predicted amidohydrolase